MKCVALGLCLLALAGCTAAQTGNGDDAPADYSPAASGPVDDGTYLAQIYPLEGVWVFERIGGTRFPPADVAGRPSNEGFIHFMEGGFINHSGGCGGSQPAFYALAGQTISVSRREKPQVGKCPDAAAMQRERLVNAFIDKLAVWRKIDAGTLELTTGDGVVAVLKTPAPPAPEIAGRWSVLSIGGAQLGTDAYVDFDRRGVSAAADCNGLWTGYILTPRGVRIEPGGAATQQGCSAVMQQQDDRLFGAISGVVGHDFRPDGTLRLIGPQEIILRRPPAADRQLAGEYEHCGNTTLGAAHSGEVRLSISGEEMIDNAGCKAVYRADGPNLTIDTASGPACAAAPAGPYDGANTVDIGGDVSPLAVLRPDGFGFDNEGRLFLRTSRGKLSLCRKSVMDRKRSTWRHSGNVPASPPPEPPPPPAPPPRLPPKQ